MKRIILFLLIIFSLTTSVLAQKQADGGIRVDVTDCNAVPRTDPASRIYAVAYYIGFDDAQSCYKLLIIVLVSTEDGESVMGYGETCIKQYTRMNASELPQSLQSVMNDCSIEKTRQKFFEYHLAAKQKLSTKVMAKL